MFQLYPRRTSFGGADQLAVAAQFGFVALYNDATMGQLLRVLRYSCGSVVGTADIVMFFTKGTVGTLVAGGATAFSDEGALAGSIYKGSDLNLPPFGYYANIQTTFQQHTQSIPVAYVKPGFSLVFKGDSANKEIIVGIAWETLTIDMLCECELK